MIKQKYNRKIESKHSSDVRCDCGKLYLIKTKEGYEFKCPRCKRIHLIKYKELLVDYLAENKAI